MIFEMKQTNVYKIPFKGLKLGKHRFDYLIEKEFFEAYPYDEFIETTVHVVIDFNKKDTIFELHFDMQGSVRINCDKSGEEYDQPVQGTYDLIVNFGNEYNDESDQILILPHQEYELDISQYIYEMIILSVPTKRIHPGVLDGTLKSKALDKLEELQNRKQKKQIDPRWEKLKGLIKD